VLPLAEIVPIAFFDLNPVVASRFLNVGERDIPFSVWNALNLIKPSERVLNVADVGQRLFAVLGKA
jgi:hypothetical protein